MLVFILMFFPQTFVQCIFQASFDLFEKFPTYSRLTENIDELMHLVKKMDQDKCFVLMCCA